MNLSTSLQTWKPIPGYEHLYLINELGTVYSINRANRKSRSRHEAYLVTRLNNCGYYYVRLSQDGVTRTLVKHRLLAQTFIPNPEGYKEVNHIDGVKTNNELANLEWMSHSQNIQHAWSTGLISRSKQVHDNCVDKTYNSAKAAAKHLGLNYNTVRNYLNGNIKNPTCLQYL